MHESDKTTAIIEKFQSHGHNEVDTARIYGGGSSEEILAEIDWKKRGIIMDTKLYPNAGGAMASADSYTHKPEDVRRGLLNSLKALQTDMIDIFLPLQARPEDAIRGHAA